jgi:hypothetical protein
MAATGILAKSSLTSSQFNSSQVRFYSRRTIHLFKTDDSFTRQIFTGPQVRYTFSFPPPIGAGFPPRVLSSLLSTPIAPNFGPS